MVELSEDEDWQTWDFEEACRSLLFHHDNAFLKYFVYTNRIVPQRFVAIVIDVVLFM